MTPPVLKWICIIALVVIAFLAIQQHRINSLKKLLKSRNENDHDFMPQTKKLEKTG